MARVPAVALMLMLTGCVGLPHHPWTPVPEAPPVTQVVVTWQNTVSQAADPVNGGRTQPVLAGRMYLFGQTLDHPQVAQGGFKVELFDETNGPSTGQPVEDWVFPAEYMPHLMKKDFLGVGYTIILPWGSYRPDIQKVKMRVGYVAANMLPVYTENVVTLDVGNGVITDITGKVTPAGMKR